MESFLYVIKSKSSSTEVKIGFSDDPEARLKQLQTGHPEPLEVIYREGVDSSKVRYLERIIHQVNKSRRLKGEWFLLSPQDAILEVKHAVIRYGDDPRSALLHGRLT